MSRLKIDGHPARRAGESYKAYRKRRAASNREISAYLTSGTPCWISCVVEPVKDAAGTIINYVKHNVQGTYRRNA